MELIDCAIIENDTVVNVIVVESLQLALSMIGGEIIEITDAGPHMGWTRVDGVWVKPTTEGA